MVVPVLVEACLKDEDKDVRSICLASLRHFGATAKNAIPLIQQSVEDPKYRQVPDLRQRVEKALEKLGRF